MLEKQRYRKAVSQPDEKILLAKVLDQADFSLTKYRPAFTAFFDPQHAAAFGGVLEQIYGLQVLCWGGNEACERRMLGMAPEDFPFSAADFPIVPLKITWDVRFAGPLGHRDCLGAVLGLGLDRSKVGDIFVTEAAAFCFLQRDIADYVCENLSGVGRVRVRAAKCCPEEVDLPRQDWEETVITLPSLRLDAVVAGIFRLSRAQAKGLIEGEKVSLNWQTAINPAAPVPEKAVLSVRGLGRGTLLSIGKSTKKNRIAVSIGRYQR